MLCSLTLLALARLAAVTTATSSWPCYGGNAQHSGGYVGTSQSAALIKWAAPIDGDPSSYGGVVYAHFAAPMITQSNNVVYGYHYNTSVGGNTDYDNWSVIGRNGATGAQVWQMNCDYNAPCLFPNNWTSVFPLTLFQTSPSSIASGVAAGAGGGSVMIRTSADAASIKPQRLVFYTTLADFNKNEAAYSAVEINTPITADTHGNLYFGYWVNGSVPSNLAALGTGGVATINVTTGKARYLPVQKMGIDGTVVRLAMNAAPTVTTDGSTMYCGICCNNGSGLGPNDPWLVKLSTKTLAVEAKVQIMDPFYGGTVALVDQSSSSPMLGPDGHVFYGVFRAQYGQSHGWMMQFDGDLSPTDAAGTAYPVGAFGWDDTAVIVNSKLVPSYTGKASYLILTKYNNYAMAGQLGANGQNHVGILDPTSNSISRDGQTSIPVMNEVALLLSPQVDVNSQVAGGHFEWCINSAAIDENRKSAIVNCEDGNMYRWNFVTNSITEMQSLEPATSEAYTMTAIGPDGTIYVLNNCVLFAIGSNNAVSISVNKGTEAKGTLKDLWYVDGEQYSLESVSTPSGKVAAVEADFIVSVKNPTALNLTAFASATATVSGTLSAYNYKTKAFVNIANSEMQPFTVSSSTTQLQVSTSSNVSNYIGPGNRVRILVEGLMPTTTTGTKFTMSIDLITCGGTSGSTAQVLGR